MCLHAKVKALVSAPIDDDIRAEAIIALVRSDSGKKRKDVIDAGPVPQLYLETVKGAEPVPQVPGLSILSEEEKSKISAVAEPVPQGTPLAAEFESWYSAYPRKTKRIDAMRAWVQMRAAMPSLAEMLAALEWQAREWKDPKYIPHPATYLRAGQWGDAPVPAKHSPTTKPAPVVYSAAKLAEFEHADRIRKERQAMHDKQRADYVARCEAEEAESTKKASGQ